MTDPILPPLLVTPPQSWPVTLAALRDHVRVEDSSQDASLEQALASAHAHCDGWHGVLGICLAEQTWEQPFRGFSADGLLLPLRPLKEVVSITYRDAAGAPQTLASTDWMVEDLGGNALILPTSPAGWPVASASHRAPVRVCAIFGPAPPPIAPQLSQLVLLLAALVL